MNVATTSSDSGHVITGGPSLNGIGTTSRTKKSKKKSKASSSTATTNSEQEQTSVDAINAVTSALEARLTLKETSIAINGSHDQIISEVTALPIKVSADNKLPILCNGSSTSHITERECVLATINPSEVPSISDEGLIQDVAASEAHSINNNNDNDQKESNETNIEYLEYENELQMPDIIRLIQKDLSEPYSIYTYRYFIHNWPKLCFLAMCGTKCVGAIVCKLDIHRQIIKRGYIAMLAVDKEYRKLKIGTNLVQKAIQVHILIGKEISSVILNTFVLL